MSLSYPRQNLICRLLIIIKDWLQMSQDPDPSIISNRPFFDSYTLFAAIDEVFHSLVRDVIYPIRVILPVRIVLLLLQIFWRSMRRRLQRLSQINIVLTQEVYQSFTSDEVHISDQDRIFFSCT